MACIFLFFFDLCCEGPWFTSIQEDGCDKGAHQSYLGADRYTLVNPNWFQPCQCCCCLRCPWESLRLLTLIICNWAQVLEACDCLKLLSINFDLCVDATGVICHQLGLLGTDHHVIGCGGFVKTHFASSSSSPAKLSMSSAKQRLVIVLPPMLTVPSYRRHLSWSFPEICWKGWVRENNWYIYCL